jgi:RNA polymerase sigma factor (sigma-70 family)
VAETFMHCWRRWQTVLPEDPGAYLRRTLINELTRAGRRNRRRTAHPIVPGPHDAPALEQSLVVRNAIAALSPERRVVVVLRYLDDLSEASVAEILGIPIGTVKSRAARGLRDLESVLRPVHEVSGD